MPRASVVLLVFSDEGRRCKGTRATGDDWIERRQRFRAQIEGVMRQALEERGRKASVGFANWSELLGSEYFFHADTATEHLHEEGRRILAGAIAEAVMEWRPGAAGTGAE